MILGQTKKVAFRIKCPAKKKESQQCDHYRRDMERCRATRRLRAKIGRPSDRIPDRLSSAFRLGRNRPSDAARPFRTDRPVQTRGKRWFRISGWMIFFLLNNLQKTLGPIGRSPVITRPVRAGQMLAKDWRALTSVSVSIDQNLTLADSDSFFPPKNIQKNIEQ